METDRQRARDWWRTSIIDMTPGVIRLRGYAIEELIGTVSIPQTIWLMLRGDLPSTQQADLLEAALVAAVDHGPQSPAIAIARMAVTAGNDLNHAMGSAINVLGDTHGGAGQQCMELLSEAARRWPEGGDLEPAVEEALAEFRAKRGRFIPGYGHRFHPIDPRAPKLLSLIDEATAAGHVSGRFAAVGKAIASSLSRGREKPIPMNIDGATAVIFCELGFEPPLGRGLFVISRAVGILAHAWEQSQLPERIKGPTPPEFLYSYDGPPPRSLLTETHDGSSGR